MKTVTGIFGNTDAALTAGERIREAAGRRATIRLFLPAAGHEVIETSLVTDRSSWTRVAEGCFALGFAGVVAFAFFDVRGSFAFLWLLWAAAGGLMLASWLTGEAYPRTILPASEETRSRYSVEARAGKAVVTAVVHSTAAAERVVRLLEEAGGRVSEGFLHNAPAEVPLAT